MIDDSLNELKALLPECMLPDQVRIGSRLALLLAKQEPGRIHPATLTRWVEQARASVLLRGERAVRRPEVHYDPQLPITAKKDEILQAIRQNQVVIVAGETGSGKTTQIPKIALEAGFGLRAKIGCTQPRRVAALSISRRIAEELRVPWGEEVGCKIRFSDQSSAHTCIKLMTDGILLAEIQGDPFLSEYDFLVIDEAHERSLNIDFLLGYLKQLLPKRTDLKVIITSATIDTEAFSAAFNGAPIVQVSGRMFPVDVLYQPLDEHAEDEGDLTYIDAAVNTTAYLLDTTPAGDVLVFMPSERDIRETSDKLSGGVRAEIIPLFGRLTAAEQQRVFAATPGRKVIVATNIAETSLTLPGIRFVIDTGLARISRYSPRTRTKRLPIEPVSQSSANQRKGRAGRVSGGVCIRLYAEADFAARPPYTQPEIQRANLAEVILRMKAFHYGEIETFPFLNPPAPNAIRAGYQLLQELGALDEALALTPLGRELARLPVDPAMGRMILESRRENALREVIIIAAGLSVQDPRERPMDQPGAADAAHRRFVDPTSDFLTLLKLWEFTADVWDQRKTQNHLRKFCKANFLSYTRMREWRDIYAQLREAVGDLEQGEAADADDDYEGPDAPAAPGAATAAQSLANAIHRSILTGLFGHLSQKTGPNSYRLAGNRQAMVFPGSALFERLDKKPSPKAAPAAPKKTTQPLWAMAGEIVETSRLFLRTLAGIDPQWILELGAHLCKTTYSDPRWDPLKGRVIIKEVVLMNGLEVVSHWIDHKKTDPAAATAMFIRSALMEDELELPQPFLAHNRKIRQKLEIIQTRLHHSAGDPDERLFEFYRGRLDVVSSIHDLNQLLKQKPADYLKVTEADLIGPESKIDPRHFPDEVSLGEQALPLTYSYAPGEDSDGVTIRVPARMVQVLSSESMDWIIPGFREEQIECLLQSLPKTLRRTLMPIPPKVKELARVIQPSQGSLPEAVSQAVEQLYGIKIPTNTWPADAIPAHLRPRIEMVGKENKVLGVARDLQNLKEQLKKAEVPLEVHAWREAVKKWEQYGLTQWSFGDLPERTEVADVGGVPLYAYPGLQVEESDVCIRLFRRSAEAETASAAATNRLCELALQRELAWLQKDLRALNAVQMLYVTLGSYDELLDDAYRHICRYLFQREAVFPLAKARFDATVAQAKARVPGLAAKFIEAVKLILEARQELLLLPKPYPGLAVDVNYLIPKRFLACIAYERLGHLPRYLKAVRIRAERAAMNGLKDQEKARRIQPYQTALAKLCAAAPPTLAAARLREDFRWLIEEYKVSCYAQELGTAQPVSPPRLDQLLRDALQAMSGK
jgi:ATP-dependent helicase HrpA